MSNLQRVGNLKQVLSDTKQSFDSLAQAHGAVEWRREAAFAWQAISANPYLQGVALKNQDSFRRAVINIAAVGLSLNPVQKQAYLVPRGGEVCLDIGYMGLISLAYDSFALSAVRAECVKENDEFEMAGVFSEPVFRPCMRGDRGETLGAFCAAKTHSGEFLVTYMTIEEINAIRDISESWKSFQSGKTKQSPWANFPDEMAKKTVIKRAYKLWPRGDTRDDRFNKAIEVASSVDPVDFDVVPESVDTSEKVANIRLHLKAANRDEQKFIASRSRATGREIKSLDDLTPIECDQAIAVLSDLVENREES